MDVLGAEQLTEQFSEKTKIFLELTKKFSLNKREHGIKYNKASNGIFDISEFEPEISNFSDHIVVSFPAQNIFPLDGNSEMFVVNSLVNIASQINFHPLKGLIKKLLRNDLPYIYAIHWQ